MYKVQSEGNWTGGNIGSNKASTRLEITSTKRAEFIAKEIAGCRLNCIFIAHGEHDIRGNIELAVTPLKFAPDCLR